MLRDAMTTVLLTRPLDQSQALTGRLTELGFTTLIAPMIEIESVVAAIPAIQHVQALVFSSQHAVHMFTRRCEENGVVTHHLRTFCVGETTAAAATKAGFKDVHNADGDSHDLMRLILDHTRPSGGVIVHVRGAEVANDLSQKLLAYGYQTESMVIYNARTSTGIPTAVMNSLYAGEVSHAMFFSPRTAQTFATLARKQGFAAAMPQMTAICMSENVADAVRNGIHWRYVRIARKPREDAMIEALQESIAE